MVKVSEIYEYLDGLAPFCNQDSFDNSGLCVGEPDTQVSRILLSLDATNAAVDEAAEQGCQLILTHHPVIFHPMKRLDMSYPAARALSKGIVCIGCHTSLDSAAYSVSDMMVDALGFENMHAVVQINRQNPKTGDPVGYGAMAKCSQTTPAELAAHAAKVFDSAALRWVDGGRKIDTVACGSGACAGIMQEAFEKGAQALITADVKLDVFLEASRIGMTLIDAGHYETEAIALRYLKEKLEETFSVECRITEIDRVVKGCFIK